MCTMLELQTCTLPYSKVTSQISQVVTLPLALDRASGRVASQSILEVTFEYGSVQIRGSGGAETIIDVHCPRMNIDWRIWWRVSKI